MSISNLETLAIGWKIAKDAEDKAKAERLKYEEAIIEASGGETSFFDLRITYKDNRSWDQTGLDVLKSSVEPQFFPFKTEYKEIAADAKALAKMHPEFWAQNFSPLLTIKPAKPSFALKGKKND